MTPAVRLVLLGLVTSSWVGCSGTDDDADTPSSDHTATTDTTDITDTTGTTDATDATALPTDGATLYATLCALCHGPNGEGYVADNANALANQGFLATASDALLTNAIASGRPGTTMSAWGEAGGGPLDGARIDAIVARIRSWQTAQSIDTGAITVDGVADRGAPQFKIRCAGCHGEDGQGGEFMSVASPGLLADADDGFLRHAISGGRAGTVMQAFGGVMTEQAIDDVVTLLRSWQSDVDIPRLALPAPLSDVVLNPDGADPDFPAEGRYLPVVELKAALDAGATLAILDARPPGDYIESHISGAVSVPFYAVAAASAALPKDVWLITYCGCPHAESDAAADALEALGYSQVKVLDEGFWEWTGQGYPVTAGPNP